MTVRGRSVWCVGMLLLAAGAVALRADDWPQWGGTNVRNMVSGEKGLADVFFPGTPGAPGPAADVGALPTVKWAVPLGPLTYSHPAIAGGRIFVGTGDRRWGDPRARRTQGGMVVCIDEASGKILWRLLVPRYGSRIHGSGFDDLGIGVCSAPTVQGDRVYVVSNRAEVLCLDVDGQADGNDGPFRAEGQYIAGQGSPPAKLYPGDADIVWRFDMIRELPCAPHDAANCNILIHGDVLYVCTSNGVHRMPTEPTPLPDAPSLIALDKKTGRLVATDAEKIGRHMFHGQWSSPSQGKVAGRDLIFFGAGDGVVYAFEPAAPPGRAGATRPGALKKVWSCDCNPPDYKLDADGWPIDYWSGDATRADVPAGWIGPSEIIGTPVPWRDKVYVAVGRDPEHGVAPGILHCIDATRTGDVTATARAWSYRKISRTMATPAIADGLLYIPDLAGNLHCLDAQTGKVQWVHQTHQPIWSSALVADGKVYVVTERRRMWVLRAGRGKQVLSITVLPHNMSVSPVAANGALYLATHRCLYAVVRPVEAEKK